MPRDDDTEFREFVRHRWPQLVRYAYVLTGDPGQAEDLVQVALERCWRRWDRIEGDNPEAYVRTAIARAAVSRFRALGRRVRETPLDAVPAGGATPDGTQTRADHAVVWAQLATLPPRMRAVVVLRVYEDLTAEETARLLGSSVGTVKSQQSRAMDRLRASAALRELVGFDRRSASGQDDAEVTG